MNVLLIQISCSFNSVNIRQRKDSFRVTCLEQGNDHFAILSSVNSFELTPRLAVTLSRE